MTTSQESITDVLNNLRDVIAKEFDSVDNAIAKITIMLSTRINKLEKYIEEREYHDPAFADANAKERERQIAMREADESDAMDAAERIKEQPRNISVRVGDSVILPNNREFVVYENREGHIYLCKQPSKYDEA